MKIKILLMVIILLLPVSTIDLPSQVMIKKFQFTETNLPSELETFKYQLKTELSKYYFVYQTEIDDINDEFELSKITDFFKTSIKLQFMPASYIISCKLNRTYNGQNFYNMYITCDEIKTRKQFIIEERSIPEENLKKAASLIASIIHCSNPSIYSIATFYNDRNFMINYGLDRGAEVGQVMDIYKYVESGYGIPIGEIKAKSVKNEVSNVEIKTYYGEDRVSLRDIKNYYVQSLIDKESEADYREKLGELRKEPNFPTETWFEAVNVTTNIFYYNVDEFKQYFNKTAFTPFIFGLQWTLIPSKNIGIFIDGKTSLYSTIVESNKISGLQYSKFLFYQFGGGVKLNLPISNIFTPGVSLSAKYHTILLKKLDSKELVVSEENINGICGELKAFASLRIFDYFGLYGDISYQFYPILKSVNREWSSSALTFGLGFCIYIKDN